MESSVLLVARCRGGTLSTIVVAAVAARPELVVVVSTRGLDDCRDELLANVSKVNLKLDKVLKGNEELCVCGSAVVGVCTIGRSGSYNQGTIAGSGCCKFGDGLDCFILIGVIG